MIVPTKALRAFIEGIRGLESSDEMIIYPFEQYIMLAYGGFTLASTLLNGPYPDYEKVIFRERPYVVSLKREKLINAMKQLLPFANQRNSRFDLNFIGHRVDISVEDTKRKIGKTESVYSERVEKLTFAVSFNAEQILCVLENIKSECVVMKVENSSRPVLILPEPQDAKAYVLYLIAPIVKK
jgi:DNA polymerase-3 subunit beta